MDRYLTVHLCHRSICLHTAIKKRFGGNQYGRLCFLGYLYIQLRFLCCHQPGWFINNCHFSFGKCALAYAANPYFRNDCCICNHVCIAYHYCRYGPPRKTVLSFYTWPYSIAHYVGCDCYHYLLFSKPVFIIHHTAARYPDHDSGKRKTG